VYSLCVLFTSSAASRHYLNDKQTIEEMLEGVIHRRGAAPRIGQEPPPGADPMDLNVVSEEGLARIRTNRYQSVAEMIERLKTAAARRDHPDPVPHHVHERVTNEWTRFVDRHP